MSIKRFIKTVKRVICAIWGHSRIQTHCFGYYHCSRCDAQVGDQLGSIYDASDVVIVGHDCDQCRVNYQNCDWYDRILTPNPFKKHK